MSYCKLCQNDICALLGKPIGPYIAGAHCPYDPNNKSGHVDITEEEKLLLEDMRRNRKNYIKKLVNKYPYRMNMICC